MNKKITLIGIIGIFITLIFSVGVLAQATVTTTELSLGSKTQEASNPEDDNGPNAVSLIGTVNIDTSALLAVTFPVTVNIDKTKVITTSKFNYDSSLSFSDNAGIENVLKNSPGLFVVEVDSSNNQLATASSTESIAIKAMVPANLDAIDANFDPAVFEVATISFVGEDSTIPTPQTVTFTGTVKLKMQRENKLEISDVKADVDGKKKSLDDGDDVENLKPSDSIDLEVEVENNFNKDSNLEIQDVDLKLDCNDNDFDVDDSTVNVGDVQEDDKQTESMQGILDDNAKDGTIGCDLSANGEDLNGAKHGFKIGFGLKVDRKNHDIQVKNINANPSSLTCEDTSFQLTVGLINLGTSNEDGVALDITSKTLGLNQRIVSNLELDEDDTSVEAATIAIDTKNIKSGTYAIQLQSFYDNVKLSDTEVIQIENLCALKDVALDVGNEDDGNDNIVLPQETLKLDQDVFKSGIGKTISIPVQLSNIEGKAIEYTLSLVNTDEFAEPASTKSVFLNPGQTSTVFLNLKVREDLADGKYSGTVKLAEAGQIIDTASFAVDVTGGAVPEDKEGSTFTLGEGSSKIFWIIGDIILIVIAIFFIRLIFMSGKNGKKKKKMADYGAESRKR